MYFRPPPVPPIRQEIPDINNSNFSSRSEILNHSPNLFAFESENSFKVYQPENKNFGN